ncbi:MAG: GntR family transcriptional regulator [Eubacterium sp.]|nr:GntR family transcriptional regulator [Eubacterium sp.]
MTWNLNEDRPIWIQLKEQLGKQIVAGRFGCGQRLPSVRDLAREAGVNPNTMQRALAALDQDGLTTTNRTSGRCVTEDESIIARLRDELAETIVRSYLDAMAEMGYSKEEAAEKIVNSR